MNKKFLSVVLFGALMVGSSVTFTGCIDNDEPAGIENLRGAKAELLRAKVAVESAEAARLNAEAARILAAAEVEKANAAYRNAEAAFQQALAEQEAAKTEVEKAKAEKLVAQYKLEMEEAAATHQKTMVTLQQDLAEAKSKYALLLKEIEIAQTLVTGEYKTALETVKQDVDAAYNEIYADGTGWADKVYDAEKDLYEAQLLKAQGGEGQESWIPELELKVTRAEGDLAADESKLQMLNDFLSKDATTADWRKEIKTLEDSISKLKLVISNYDVEISKIEQSDGYLAADKAVTAAEKALEGITTSKYTYEYKYDESKAYGRKSFEIADKAEIKPGNKTEGAEFEVNKEIKEVKAQLALYTAQKIAILDEVAANQKELIESKKDAYDKALKNWKTAKAKYDGAGDYDDEAAEKAVKAAGDSFDKAVAAAENITDAEKKAEAKSAAHVAYAKALVSYYTEADKYVGCTTNEVTLKIADPAGATVDVKKTVLAWLSDATYPGTYLKMILENGYTTAGMYGDQAIKSIGNATTLLNELKAASAAAFGTSDDLLKGKDYMYVEPTTEEIRAIENYATVCGAAGDYYYVSDPLTIEEANNYKAIMADFEAAITSLTVKSEAMAKAVSDAKTTLATKKAEFKVFEDSVKAVKTKQGVATSSKNAIDEVRKTLVTAAKTHLGLDDVNGFVDTEQFEKDLKAAVVKAEDAVTVSQKALAKAQANLKKAQEGKYDAVATAQKDLDEANEGLAAAQKAYEEALANLKTALEIMAKSAE